MLFCLLKHGEMNFNIFFHHVWRSSFLVVKKKYFLVVKKKYVLLWDVFLNQKTWFTFYIWKIMGLQFSWTRLQTTGHKFVWYFWNVQCLQFATLWLLFQQSDSCDIVWIDVSADINSYHITKMHQYSGSLVDLYWFVRNFSYKQAEPPVLVNNIYKLADVWLFKR